MADFCKQCSESLFGQDHGDLKGLTDRDDVFPLALCEGCGFVQVDKDGSCVSPDCIEKHGAST